ncbi:acyl carrier protein [Ruminiclostridium josui]|uniref:acyl carrier protein n=1 Tax=Ruminiclostridium josui TaxID=1499 RepID=UPI000467BA4C|nr:acyl carrier protein [Ruminiclostridium josui]
MTKQEIFCIIKENILEILPDLPEESITIEESLKNLGANSIDRMDIIVDTIERLQLKIPLVEFGMLKNIGEIVDLLYEKKMGS